VLGVDRLAAAGVGGPAADGQRVADADQRGKRVQIGCAASERGTAAGLIDTVDVDRSGGKLDGRGVDGGSIGEVVRAPAAQNAARRAVEGAGAGVFSADAAEFDHQSAGDHIDDAIVFEPDGTINGQHASADLFE